MVRAICVALFAMATGVQPCASASPKPVESPQNRVRLEATFMGIRAGFPVLRVMLINDSSESFWVNKRMIWNGSEDTPIMGELRIDVRDAKDHSLNFMCKKNVRPIGVFDYVVLRPRDFVGADIELDCLRFAAGRYKAVVYFRDLESPQGLRGNFRRLTDELVSGAVEIVVGK